MSMKECINKYKVHIILGTLFLVLFCGPFIPYFSQYWGRDNSPLEEYTLVYYWLASILTLLIVYIAHNQFQNVNKKLKTDYMIKIDEIWHKEEIIKARIIIHKIYLKERKEWLENGHKCEICLHHSIGERIVKLSEENADKNIEDFIYLLNFLEFMESVAYYNAQHRLEEKDILELCTPSLAFNYEIFQPYINHKRDKHKNSAFYTEFGDLYNRLPTKNIKPSKDTETKCTKHS